MPQIVGGSPFVFVAPGPGTLVVASGKTELSRNGGGIYYTVGLQGGTVPVLISDQVRVSWTGSAPLITFFPST